MDNQKRVKRAFTLIEVLISITLLGILLVALYSLLDRVEYSNKKLHRYLQNTLQRDRVVTVLYNDILQSDGNITIKGSDYDRVCINSTKNSLYALNEAKVCWIVSKDGNKLVRIEGNNYKLPLESESRVNGDIVMDNIEIFRVENSKKGIIVVVLKKIGVKPYTFAIYGITPPILPKNRKRKKSKTTDKTSTATIEKKSKK